ncbi:MAG TPA: SGNH/GDSL hydrolase family protein [Acidimicrobiales bacterium]|nr:SGNH/GDSL hydrolase family protein [Acidimicrobiales bacterium]
MAVLVTTLLAVTPAAGAGAGPPRTAARSASSGADYVALGDSYASGEGNPPFIPPTAGNCDRSEVAYGYLLSGVLEQQGLGFQFPACSGATTTDVLTTGQYGYPPQVDSISPSTQVMTVTVGGDDVGFSTVLAFCFLVGCQTAAGYVPAVKNLGRDISLLEPRLVSTYEQLEADAPQATLIVVGYPDLFPPHPGPIVANMCPPAFPDIPVDWGNVGFLAPYERQLDSVVQEAAYQAGATFVDPNVAGAPYSFLGHDVCSDSSWFNPLEIVNPDYSYHPTATGQSELEQAVLAQTGLAGGLSALRAAGRGAYPAAAAAEVARLPRHGPGLSITEVGLRRSGDRYSISATGFAPGSTVEIGARAPGDLGRARADADGAVRVRVRLAGRAIGTRAVVLTGRAADGDARVVFGPTAWGLGA